MPVLPETEIRELLAPYEIPLTSSLLAQLSDFLDLLVRWNARTNLTAVRFPQEMVRRHFGESLFTGMHLGKELPANLLDLGSGAGFPGVPIALLHPSLPVTLAESQNKKATFLREVVRTLRLQQVEVWAARAEALSPSQTFHTVTLRAVDNMEAALAAAAMRASRQIVLLTTGTPSVPMDFVLEEEAKLPNSERAVVARMVRN